MFGFILNVLKFSSLFFDFILTALYFIIFSNHFSATKSIIISFVREFFNCFIYKRMSTIDCSWDQLYWVYIFPPFLSLFLVSLVIINRKQVWVIVPSPFHISLQLWLFIFMVFFTSWTEQLMFITVSFGAVFCCIWLIIIGW